MHLVSYRAGDKAPRDHGPVADQATRTTPSSRTRTASRCRSTAGIVKMPDGMTTTKYVILGVCEAHDGSVYVLALHPYTLLQVTPDQLKEK